MDLYNIWVSLFHFFTEMSNTNIDLFHNIVPVISRSHKLIWRSHEWTSRVYDILSRSHNLICCGHDKTKWTEDVHSRAPYIICVWAALKKDMFFPSQNVSSSDVPLCKLVTITFHTVWMLYRLLALAYISFKAQHCSSRFGDTDAIPYIVITEESNINVFFILYTSTIRTKCYELLL